MLARLFEDFDMQPTPESSVVWGVACCNENALAFSYAFAQWIEMVYYQRTFC
jgi:hypothetical protein